MNHYPYAPPVVPSQSDQMMPEDVRQLALQHQIGELRTVYRPRVTNPIALLGAIVLLVALEIALIVALFFFWHIANRFTIFLLVLPVFAMVYCIDAFIHRSYRVYLLTSGIIAVQKKQMYPIRWDQVSEVWHTWTRQISGDLIHKYVIRLNDGTQIKLGSYTSSLYVNVLELGSIIEQEVAQIAFNTTVLSFETGQSITFGKISVSMQGISSGKTVIPWYQIGTAEMQEGKLVIRQGKEIRPLKPNRLKNIPNIRLFMMLVNHEANRLNYGIAPGSLPGMA